MNDFEKAQAELPILRDFIDFVNAQVGVYMDCLSGFEGNTVRIRRQVARINRPVGRKIENGQQVVMWESLEDPRSPDVIHSRIIRTQDFIASNAEAGPNEQQACWSIIVFMFAYWNEEVRPNIAKIRGVAPEEIKIDALGDLRILRNSIIHDRSIISAASHAKLKAMSHLAKADEKIVLSHDQMHNIFVLVKRAIAEIIMRYVGHLSGAPDRGQRDHDCRR